MCDYSLHGVPNRLAVQDEDLMTFRFSTGCIGLVEAYVSERCRAKAMRGPWTALRDYYFQRPENVIHAVCVPPGARLRLNNVPLVFQQRFDLSASEYVTFTQLSAEPFRYRDAVRFRNGSELLIQRLGEGVRVRVVN